MLVLLGAFDDRRLVEQHALQLRVRFQYRGQEAAVTAADIHQRPEPRELIRRRNGGILSPGETGHRFAEDLEVFRVFLEILEGRDTVGFYERYLARLYAIEELFPCVPCVFLI